MTDAHVPSAERPGPTLTPHGWRMLRERALNAAVDELTGGKPVPEQVRERMWQALGKVFGAGCNAGPCPGRRVVRDPVATMKAQVTAPFGTGQPSPFGPAGTRADRA